jgi:hypothetical protein
VIIIKKILQSVMPTFMLERLGLFLYRTQLFNQGTWPLWRAKQTLRRKAKNPETYAQKVMYKMAYDRRDFLSVFADKVAVRNYVAARIGDRYLAKVYAILNSASIKDFDPNTLPRNFVIKVNHASGGTIIVSESATQSSPSPFKLSKSLGWERFFIHPDDFDWEKVKIIIINWLINSYYWTPGFFPEWAYKNIKPLVIIEEYLGNQVEILNDYRFFTFNGKCEFISTGAPFYHHSGVLRDFYTNEWNKIPVRELYPNCDEIQPRPSNLDEMVRVSESLAAGIDHVRIDLYERHDGIFFGEMTNYHNAGNSMFIPESFNYELAKSWHPETWY